VVDEGGVEGVVLDEVVVVVVGVVGAEVGEQGGLAVGAEWEPPAGDILRAA